MKVLQNFLYIYYINLWTNMHLENAQATGQDKTLVF